jgi:hypothetical protein
MSLLNLPPDLFYYYFIYFLDTPTLWSLRQTCKLLNKIIEKLDYYDFCILNPYDLVRFGYKNLYKYAIQHIKKNMNIPTFRLVNNACLYGQIKLIKYFYKNDYTFCEDACSFASAGGHLVLLKWLRKKRVSWDQWSITCAINNKQYHIVEYALKKKAPLGYFAEHALEKYYTYLRINGK